ncbi:MAG: 50S ribosomal protein L13 [Candidatus Kaiserbacteria bacterium GW2011_GWC2_52_8b]|uniref:50S ribosomal protein L13 n=2 Tax=Candidatus Kaiseribacteriota TaxID=1752734 RepID=A0A0G1XEQ7_9BACT|nr:MAG: 50S ribosomal protein L13 [Candidatus Kaiserbacteria bacterium GW2011_GWA2_52_12]KKW29743.1 MAG: 50S ribosomal protein L13 [Candidatus Kaiserbacteria bacterium GW2011_GWC2_52_8b]
MAGKTQKMNHQIDASGKTLGRVASEAAKALMGKMSASYTPHVLSDVRVTISNASKLYTRERKQAHTVLTHYTGWHSGLRSESLAALAARKGYGATIRHAVQRMLPRNTMLVARMKNLIISE